jgi:hypothetical protein
MRVNRGQSNRESLLRSFEGIASVVSPNPNQVASTASFFQQGPMSGLADFEEVFGTADEFLERYRLFQGEYHAALDVRLDHFKTNRIVAEMTKKRQKIDLGLLAQDASSDLTTYFKDKVMRYNRLFNKQGLPGVELPSANLYRSTHLFEVDNSQGIVHPAQILLNDSSFNFNPEKKGLDSISTGMSMPSFEAIQRMWDNYSSVPLNAVNRLTKQIDPFKNISEGQNVLTVDVETTGLFNNAQVRSFAAAEMRVQNGILTAPETVLNVGFRSNQLNGINVPSLNGATQDLNSFIMRMENSTGRTVSDMGSGGEKFLDEFNKLTERMLNADRVAGHNIGFDLDMMARTAMAQEGFSTYKTGGFTAAERLEQINEKIAGGDYLVDTLQSTRAFLKDQAQEAIKTVSLDKRSAEFAKTLLASEVSTNVKLGGAAKYAGVGEFVMNTNFFELLESDSPQHAERIFELITQGSHIAETDIHLQSYIGKFLHEKTETGQLKIKALAEREGQIFSEFGEYARMRILKSQAITPTTNIASVRHMSQTTFDYLQRDEGLRNISMRVDIGTARSQFGITNTAEELIGTERARTILSKNPGVNLEREMGTLSHMDGKFVFATAEGAYEIQNQDSAKSFIRTKLQEAQALETNDTLRVAGKSLNLTRNVADEAFIDFGMSLLTQSQSEDLVNIGKINVSGTPKIAEITKALGSTYEKLGTGFSISDQIRTIFRANTPTNPFSKGFKAYTPSGSSGVTKSIAEDFASIGDPYARFIDTRSRIVSSLLAESTAGIAERAGMAAMEVNQAAMAAGDVAKIGLDKISHLSMSRSLSELGVSHFKSQDVLRVFDIGSPDKVASSRILVQPEIIKDILARKSTQAGSSLAGLQMRVGLSRANMGQEGIRINAVWNIGEEAGDNAAREMAESLFDVFTSGEDNVAKILNVGRDELSPDIIRELSQAQMLNQGERTTTIDNLTAFIKERGIGVGYIDKKDAVMADKSLNDVFVSLDNDVLSGMRMFEETTDYSSDLKYGERVLAFGPVHNPQAIEAAGLSAEFEAARKMGPGETVSPLISAQKRVASVIESEGAGNQIIRSIATKKSGLAEGAGRAFYNANKTKIGFAALGAAAVGASYYLYKKHKETALYDETLAQQPTQRGTGSDRTIGAPLAPRNPNYSNPLATAGVVGNLDRLKIGHTQMGNNKNNHLFGM